MQFDTSRLAQMGGAAIASANKRKLEEYQIKQADQMHKASLAWFETQSNLSRQQRQLRASGGVSGSGQQRGGAARTMLTDFLYNATGKTLLGG